MSHRLPRHCGRCEFVGVIYNGDNRREVWIHPMEASTPERAHIIVMSPSGDYENARINQISKSSSRGILVRGMNLAAARDMLPPEEKARWAR